MGRGWDLGVGAQCVGLGVDLGTLQMKTPADGSARRPVSVVCGLGFGLCNW